MNKKTKGIIPIEGYVVLIAALLLIIAAQIPYTQPIIIGAFIRTAPVFMIAILLIFITDFLKRKGQI